MVEALTEATSVTVAVTYEDEREAAAPRATLHERLRERADEVVALPPNAEHTESPVLFALERGLFEDAPERAEPDDGLVLHGVGRASSPRPRRSAPRSRP